MNRTMNAATVLGPSTPDPRLVAETVATVVRAHGPLLVRTARQHLRGPRRQDAEDVVQDVCLAVLEGLVTVSTDPAAALDDLLREIAAAASLEK